MFASAVGVVLSAWVSVGELDYALRGKFAAGKITQIKRRIERSRFLHQGSTQTIEYEFPDAAGNIHAAQDTVSVNWKAPEDGQIRVQYMPDRTATSRIAGHINWGPIGSFAVSLLLFAAIVVYVRRQRRREQAQP